MKRPFQIMELGKRLRSLLLFLSVAALVVCFRVLPAFAVATTVTLPDYSTPLLTPASQSTNSWTNIIPNALATYYTYSPYSNANAVALGFPSTCGNLALSGAADLSSTEDCYTITVKKFQQQLAIPGIFSGGTGLLDQSGTSFGAVTWVYGYGSGGINWTPPGASVSVTGNAPTPFVDNTFGTSGIWHFPAPTIRGTKGRPIRVQWLNELPNEAPVGLDPTVDCGMNAPYCYPYNRIVTHVHGAHVTDDSDGFADAWFTPLFATTGPSWKPSTHGPEGTFLYPMDQEAGTIWYHDHAMGTTHTNTEMGLAGFFPITDSNEQSLITGSILPTGNYELGFALQDRYFDINGQFAMPDYPIYDLLSSGCTLTTGDVPDPATCTRLDWMHAADGHLIPYVVSDPLLSLPTNSQAPYGATSTSLEFFGNMPVVNGVTYGKYDVEPRIYRMRFIGGTDSRTWIMQLMRRDNSAVIPFWQIGSEQGFLNHPVSRTSIDLMSGERIDTLVDFTGVTPGTHIVMKNLGPDDPYAGPGSTFDPSSNIPEIMEFVVTALTGTDTIIPPTGTTNLRPVSGAVVSLTPTSGTAVRRVSLIEIQDEYGRTLPTIDAREFMQSGVPITEMVRLNDTEEWDIINTTVDAHPIHLHQVAFQVISRQSYTGFVAPVTDIVNRIFTQPTYTSDGSSEVAPYAWEEGWKDTIDCPPGMVTKVKAKFDIAGNNYVWHCHILSHEEHDMMRGFTVSAPATSVTISASQASPHVSGTSVVFTPTGFGASSGFTGYQYRFLLDGSEVQSYGVGTTWVMSAATPTGAHTVTVETRTSTGVASDASASLSYSIVDATYSVTPSAGTGGTLSPGTVQTVNYGGTTSFTVTPGTGYHIVSVSGCSGSLSGSTYTTGTITASCTVSATFALPDGNLGYGGTVDDALAALQIAANITTPTTYDLEHGDVAPLVNGSPQPDGKIDVGDVVVILRRAVGLVTW